MAYLAALLRGTRAPLRRGLARPASWSCAGETPPPAGPPCRPHAPPPCRRPPPCSEPVAIRVVCCAPPRTRRPPCDPRPPARALTCVDVRSGCAARCAPAAPSECDPRCGASQDGVARHLAAAAAERRRIYEEEVSGRLAAVCRVAPPPVPYTPGAARSCLPATDGRTYALPCSLRPHARCGPCRTPPAPEPLPLARDPKCRLADLPNPCAHRPRVFLEVDRDPPAPPGPPPPAPPSPPAPSPPCGCGPAPQPARGLAERIVAGLRGQAACATEAETRRRLHTLAPRAVNSAGCAGGAARPTGVSELERALSARSSLKEAGRGRSSVRCGTAPAAPPAPPAGRLELAVPPGATRLCVLVSLGTDGSPPATCPSAAAAGAVPCASSADSRSDSWLSIKSIQRKFSCGRDKPVCPAPPTPPKSPSCPPPTAIPSAKPSCPPYPAVKPSCPTTSPPKPKPPPCTDKGSKVKKFTTWLPLLA